MQEKLSPSMFIGIQGDDYISFGSGQPDLPPPERVFKILPDYRQFKYGLIQGQENLRNALSKQNQFKGSDKDSFVITNGASEALDLTFRAICKPGDKILFHKPYYYSYIPMAKLSSFEPVFTETIKGKIDFDDFDKKVRDCKCVLINSPSNPTGRVQDVNTLKKIEKLCADLDITIISDEVYKDLIYIRENYMLSGPHVVTINSFSKTFAMCGLRVGYLYSNDKKIIHDVIELKTHTSMNTSILSQEMAYEATKVPREYIKDQVKIWEKRRDFIYEGLQKLGLDLWKPEGAFYVLPKIDNPKDAVWNLFKKHKVITYLGEWFGAPDRIRLSYALDVEKIEEGLKRLEKYLKETS
ncbi:MAG: pyridoxal phosphate-dependent aminotransferase [Nanoarchaeota archaeon]|nr:pyridoxal phosphate-dependent aminotransferase [Nanoarchaeota archaeon]MBU1005021.1 pyridoxal phosphate-dependent aminotransferase [Nanoarchaeota archaeon]MBU1945913.1 pyridoxal phosphate-dependent aminotransferase [Nanoarchaeota archaeon]